MEYRQVERINDRYTHSCTLLSDGKSFVNRYLTRLYVPRQLIILQNRLRKV